MRLSNGGISFETVMEMEVDELLGWTSEAVSLLAEINKAMSRK
ncbi:hypothetical protein [Rhodoplanes serenus]|nr:hypothetical protein [Rhodoplanes serenus]